MKKLILIQLLSFNSIFLSISAQTPADTIIAYTYSTHIIDTIPPINFDPSKTSDSTLSYKGVMVPEGSMNNSFTLNLNPYSNFTIPVPASHITNVESYPASCDVKIYYYQSGNKVQCCSGTLVADNFVITANHCVRSVIDHSFQYDSLEVIPAFDNGHINSLQKFSRVTRSYVFKSTSLPYPDIALLQLKEPLGYLFGYTGLWYIKDSSIYKTKRFHKFSYPVLNSITLPSKNYNGDTLFYNYGFIDKVINWPFHVGLKNDHVATANGQSGSSLIHESNNHYYLSAVLSLANNYSHCHIDNNIFYQFKHIIETNQYVGIKNNTANNNQLIIYPNPFENTLVISSGNLHTFTLKILNPLGQQVFESNDISTNNPIDLSGIDKGIYFYQILNNGKYIKGGKIIKK